MTSALCGHPAELTGRLRVPVVILMYVLGSWVALPALLWAVGRRLDVLLALPSLPPSPWRAAGLALAGAGLAWSGWAMWALRRYGAGLPISHLPPRHLTRRGPYAWVRHPIYLGYTVAFTGAGLVARSAGCAVGAAALLAIGVLTYATGFEEPRLARRYGAAFEAYRAVTPLVPRMLGGRAVALAVRAWKRLRPLVERLANHTTLFRAGPLIGITFGGFAAAAAAVLAVGIAGSFSGGALPTRETGALLAALAFAVPAGSRAMWLLYAAGAGRSGAEPLSRRVGFVSWGGYLALLAASVGFAYAAHRGALWVLDRTILFGLAAQAAARLGCLTYGCCYGRPSPLGIRWTDPVAKVVREHGAAGAEPRVPTQLLSSAHAFGLFLALLAIADRGASTGAVSGLGLASYGLGRAAVECLRAEPRYTLLRLSLGQFFGVGFTAAGVALLLAVPAAERTALTFSLAGLPTLLPVVGACVMVVFAVYGLHWKRVGSW